MSGANEEKLVRVFSGTLWQAEIIKGLLDANAVPCVIKDDSIGAVTSSYAALDGDVFVIVNEEDEAKALEIIKENSMPDAQQE
jgi:type III secretory pathway lipoprotein EscJ